MKINEAQFDMSNYDIAMDFYQSIMHFISNNKDTHVDIHEIMMYLKYIEDSDASPLAVELRKQYAENVFQFEQFMGYDMEDAKWLHNSNLTHEN